VCGYTPNKEYEYNGQKFRYSELSFEGCFVVDHIKPIALGGSEWDEDNMQTLCVKCNKVKTARDARVIARQRVKDQLLAAGQRLFGGDE
jgi:hypothetical protein